MCGDFDETWISRERDVITPAKFCVLELSIGISRPQVTRPIESFPQSTKSISLNLESLTESKYVSSLIKSKPKTRYKRSTKTMKQECKTKGAKSHARLLQTRRPKLRKTPRAPRRIIRMSHPLANLMIEIHTCISSSDFTRTALSREIRIKDFWVD